MKNLGEIDLQQKRHDDGQGDRGPLAFELKYENIA
jgi:hypothetical protein